MFPGKQVSVRLNRSQIDKASKDKSSKFSDNFNVTFFPVRPNDQALKEDYSRGQMAESLPSVIVRHKVAMIQVTMISQRKVRETERYVQRD